jgi:hypothetical protein
MNAFRRWLALALGLFGLAAWGYHAYLTAWPRKVLVIVDGSYPMSAVWDQVPPLLKSLSAGRYQVHALATDRGLVHGWQASLDLGSIRPYAPRHLAGLPQRLPMAGLGQADATYLITNAPPGKLPTDTGWTVLSPADASAPP